MQTDWIDHHVHSDVSPDGRAPMEQMCARAEQLGMRGLVFTEHFECYRHPERSRFFKADYLPAYRRRWNVCRARFPGLDLRFGLELGQPWQEPEKAAAALREYPFDFVLGSVHKLSDTDLGKMRLTNTNAPGVAQAYARGLQRMQDQPFDCLGHLDLIRRYALRSGCADPVPACAELLFETLRWVAQQGRGIELNTSGLRQGAGGPLPSSYWLRQFRLLGGRIVTLGSDAHRPEDVAADFQAGAALLRAAGFDRLAEFRARKPEFRPL